jgi:hypothetical protein
LWFFFGEDLKKLLGYAADLEKNMVFCYPFEAAALFPNFWRFWVIFVCGDCG